MSPWQPVRLAQERALLFSPVKNAKAALAVFRRQGHAVWLSPQCLRSVEDYERCARAASARVVYVAVRCVATDPAMPPGEVEVKVRGCWRRRLPEEEVRKVRHALVRDKPINVALRMT